jgi:hypothetical protein
MCIGDKMCCRQKPLNCGFAKCGKLCTGGARNVSHWTPSLCLSMSCHARYMHTSLEVYQIISGSPIESMAWSCPTLSHVQCLLHFVTPYHTLCIAVFMPMWSVLLQSGVLRPGIESVAGCAMLAAIASSLCCMAPDKQMHLDCPSLF